MLLLFFELKDLVKVNTVMSIDNNLDEVLFKLIINKRAESSISKTVAQIESHIYSCKINILVKINTPPRTK